MNVVFNPKFYEVKLADEYKVSPPRARSQQPISLGRAPRPPRRAR